MRLTSYECACLFTSYKVVSGGDFSDTFVSFPFRRVIKKNGSYSHDSSVDIIATAFSGSKRTDGTLRARWSL